MKERVSATIDSETKKKIKVLVKEDCYRNISHLIEDAIVKLYETKRGARKHAR